MTLERATPVLGLGPIGPVCALALFIAFVGAMVGLKRTGDAAGRRTRVRVGIEDGGMVLHRDLRRGPFPRQPTKKNAQPRDESTSVGL